MEKRESRMPRNHIWPGVKWIGDNLVWENDPEKVQETIEEQRLWRERVLEQIRKNESSGAN